MAKVRRGAASA